MLSQVSTSTSTTPDVPYPSSNLKLKMACCVREADLQCGIMGSTGAVALPIPFRMSRLKPRASSGSSFFSLWALGGVVDVL